MYLIGAIVLLCCVLINVPGMFSGNWWNFVSGGVCLIIFIVHLIINKN